MARNILATKRLVKSSAFDRLRPQSALQTTPDNGEPVRLPVPPVLFDQEGGDPPPAPDFGQHTDEVLGELGLGADRIAALRASGIVG